MCVSGDNGLRVCVLAAWDVGDPVLHYIKLPIPPSFGVYMLWILVIYHTVGFMLYIFREFLLQSFTVNCFCWPIFLT